MTLSITESIEIIRNKIATFTGVNVTPGMPDDSEPGLYIFPYNFSIDTHIRNVPARERESQANQAYYVKCLLIHSPSGDYGALSKGFNCLATNPVLGSNEETIKVNIGNVSTEELASLFISAGATYRLSIPFELHCTANLGVTT